MEQLIFDCDNDNNRYVVTRKKSDIKFEDGVLQFYLIGSGSTQPILEADPASDSDLLGMAKIRCWVPRTRIETHINGKFSKVDINKLNPNDYYMLMNTWETNVFNDTLAFQKKFALWEKKLAPDFLDEDKMKVKLNHMQEELQETLAAYKNKNIYDFCDGILDLIYVASGTLNLMNAPAQALWTDIHLRNMEKVRATKDTMGKRGSTFDVVKPKGWVGPRTEDIIKEAGHKDLN